jgi:hypothetical protein
MCQLLAAVLKEAEADLRADGTLEANELMRMLPSIGYDQLLALCIDPFQKLTREVSSRASDVFDLST